MVVGIDLDLDDQKLINHDQYGSSDQANDHYFWR